MTRGGGVLLERRRDVLRLRGVDGAEEPNDPLALFPVVTAIRVRVPPDRPQKLGRLELPLAVDLDVQLLPRSGFELKPGAPVRDHFGRVQVAPSGGILRARVVDTGRPDELAHHDALGAVDDERPLVGHKREVAEVDLLTQRLARTFWILQYELHVHIQRLGEGPILLATFEL